MATESTASPIANDLSRQPLDTASDRQPFLRFQLDSEQVALLPVAQLAEILRVPTAAVVPVPGMSAWVMGVHNWRGEILWVVDLGHLVGRAPWYQQSQLTDNHTVIVSRLGSPTVSTQTSPDDTTGSSAQAVVGLAVHAIDDIEAYDTNAIQPVSAAAFDPMASFARGYWVQSEEETVPILSGSALLSRLTDANLSSRLETAS